MTTQIKLSKALNDKEALIIFTDINNKWNDPHLSKSEMTLIQKHFKDGVHILRFNDSDRYIFIVGVEEKAQPNFTIEDIRLNGNKVCAELNKFKIKTTGIINKTGDEKKLLALVEGMALGNYQFLKYRKDEKAKNSLEQIKIQSSATSQKNIDELQIIVDSVCLARDLINEPLSFLTAEQFSEEMKKSGKESGFKVEVLDKAKIKALKMGGVLSVNLGSTLPPTFNILEWKPSNAVNKKPIVLVGKGIVYDTGGLSLKSTPNGMDMMKCDMSGGAAMVGTLSAIAKMKLPVHVVALIPATENRPGGNAYVPGDIITISDGTTVEVLNTDAEGRLVLADALHYAKRYNPELVIDAATLTGAAARAIGSEGIVYMGTAEENIKSEFENCGQEVFERLVEFPLWDEYAKHMKSDIADLKNIGGGDKAGAITAGIFLKHFTDYPWLHLDIAAPAFLLTADGYRTKGGTGCGVRLLVNYLKHRTSKTKS